MTRNGDRITFAAVARAANVSTWLTYADGVRENIESAIHQQRSTRPQPATTAQASPAGIRADLALAREEIRRLRAERDQLQQTVRRHLGQLGARDCREVPPRAPRHRPGRRARRGSDPPPPNDQGPEQRRRVTNMPHIPVAHEVRL
ncbi:hypothetical protein [Streptomyces decoyicus]|uniref:hypothetical protein n=1 Tax=Streptomyces decoyicus TaxID=249567 RepID=UPI00386A24E9